MKATINFFLSLSLYGLFILSCHASVSRDCDDQSAGFAGTESSKPQIVQPSASPLMVQDTSKVSNLSLNLTADSNAQNLKDIDDLRPYFKDGSLLIKPATYAAILNFTTSYKSAFKGYDGMIALKRWGEQDDLQGLLKLLYSFTALNGVECYKNAWSEDTAVKTLSKALQFYANLSTLDLRESVFSDKQVSKLLAGKGQNNPSSLTSINIQASSLSSKMLSELKSSYPNANFGANTSNKATVMTVQDTEATPQAIDYNNNDAGKKPRALSLAQPSKKLTDKDIHVALNKMKAKTFSIEDFAAFINSDPTLITVDLDWEIIDAEGAKAIATILKVNSTLTTAYLSRNAIGVEGVKAIAEALKKNKTLTTIDLSGNAVGDEGGKAIAEALKDNKALTKINLYNNAIMDEGAKAIAGALKDNKILATIDLNGNQIGNEGASFIAIMLKENKTLTKVNLYNNLIMDEGAIAIATALKDNKTLTRIDLSGNKIINEGMRRHPAGRRALDEIKRNRPSLDIVY